MKITHILWPLPAMVDKLKLAHNDRLKNAACIGSSSFSSWYPPAAEFIFSLFRDFAFLHRSLVLALALQHRGVQAFKKIKTKPVVAAAGGLIQSSHLCLSCGNSCTSLISHLKHGQKTWSWLHKENWVLDLQLLPNYLMKAVVQS